MESWQKAHIKKNHPELLETTNCNRELLQALKQKNLLTDSEYGTLIDTLQKPIPAVQKLYKILMSHKGSYEVLKSILFQLGQKTAHQILSQAASSDLQTSFESFDSIVYNKSELLGRGCYGTKVHKGRYKDRDVAVKVINLEYAEGQKVSEEIKILQELVSHPNVVQFYGSEEKPGYIYIALELCETNLNIWVRQKHIEAHPIDIIAQASRGIQHLHKNNIVHYDLKPVNILLQSYRKKKENRVMVKITDFGISRNFTQDQQSVSLHSLEMGTEGWMAPEVLRTRILLSDMNSTEDLGYKADIFALGCIFYFTLTSGSHPYGDSIRRQGYIVDNKLQLRKQDEEKMPPDIYSLVLDMVSGDPNLRPHIVDVLSVLEDHAKVFLTRENSQPPEDGTSLQNGVQANFQISKLPVRKVISCIYYKHAINFQKHPFFIKSSLFHTAKLRMFQVGVPKVFEFLNCHKRNVVVLQSLDLAVTVCRLVDTIPFLVNQYKIYKPGDWQKFQPKEGIWVVSIPCLREKHIKSLLNVPGKFIFVTNGTLETVSASIHQEEISWLDLTAHYRKLLAHKLGQVALDNNRTDVSRFVMDTVASHANVFSGLFRNETLINVIRDKIPSTIFNDIVCLFMEYKMRYICQENHITTETALSCLSPVVQDWVSKNHTSYFKGDVDQAMLQKYVFMEILEYDPLKDAGDSNAYRFSYDCLAEYVLSAILKRS